jgi:hypothetical protein
MRKFAGFILLGLGVILGLVGVWSALVLAPWAFVGAEHLPPDYVWLALSLSPLLLSAILLVTGLVLHLRQT